MNKKWVWVSTGARLRKELLTELTIIDGYMARWHVVVGIFPLD